MITRRALLGAGAAGLLPLIGEAAFLNERVRDEPFDFLKGTLGARMLRESLRREVWTLGPSPLRLVD